eukprot:364933-Chlamydomonas_euryale.AAC.13
MRPLRHHPGGSDRRIGVCIIPAEGSCRSPCPIERRRRSNRAHARIPGKRGGMPIQAHASVGASELLSWHGGACMHSWRTRHLPRFHASISKAKRGHAAEHQPCSLGDIAAVSGRAVEHSDNMAELTQPEWHRWVPGSVGSVTGMASRRVGAEVCNQAVVLEVHTHIIHPDTVAVRVVRAGAEHPA